MLNLKQIREKKSAGINIPDFDILLAAAIDKNKEFIFAHPEYRLNFWQYIKFNHFLGKVRRGYPAACITGHKEFFGLDFFVSKHTLIPRPETELLVETAIDALLTSDFGLRPTILIDIGTGSGCVPISIAKKVVKPLKIVAIDISHSALRLAKKNAKRHGVNIKFLHGNLLEPAINNSRFQIPYSFIVITANLPYLTEAQFQSENSIQKEPKTALVADNNNGLSLYKKLFEQFSNLSSIVHCPSTIIFEIDPRQAKAARELVKKYFPKSKIEIKKDLAGHDRLVLVEISAVNSTQ